MLQPSLPLDCLALLMDFVDDPGTLYALLTVSKAVSSMAVKRLYRSMSMVNKHRRRTVHAFVRLVLSLTPCQDPKIQALKDEWQITTPCVTRHTYLALIRDVAFHPDDDPACWRTDRFPRRNSAVYRGMDLRPWIAWAICAYSGLAKVTALTIECHNLSRYQAHVARFSALRRIILDVGSSDQVVFVHALVRQLIQIHGPKVRRISLELTGAYKDDFATVLDIYAMLDPPHPQPHTIRASTFASYVLYQDTTDLSRVRALEGFYDDLGRTRAILPRCPRLESLSARLATHGPSLFDWLRPGCVAAENRRVATQDSAYPSLSCPCPRSPGRSVLEPFSLLPPTSSPSLPAPPSPPPIKHLQLHGSPVSVFHTLCDAVACFGPTLETIWLQDPDDTHDSPQVYRLGAGLWLPRLRELRIVFELNEYSISFQPSSLPTMPTLQVLEMYHAFDRYADIGGLQYHPDYHDRYPLATWDILPMPALKALHLSGRSAAEFHPGSLRYSPVLESMTIRIRSSDWAPYWPRLLWTWDWHFPCLTDLHLGGVLASTFCLSALRFMPRLESLRLECNPSTRMPVPDYETVLAMGSHDNDDEQMEATTSTALEHEATQGMTAGAAETTTTTNTDASRMFGRHVKRVIFGGRLWLTARDWEQLLGQWFPNLEELNLELLLTRRPRVIFKQARRHGRLQWLSLSTSDDEHDDDEEPVDEQGDWIDKDCQPLEDQEDWIDLRDCRPLKELEGSFSRGPGSEEFSREGSNRGGLDKEGVDREELDRKESSRARVRAREQSQYFVCRIDDVLYRVKKVCENT